MMSRFFFDCLVDDHLHSDAFGVIVSEQDVSDQAQAVLLNLLQETLPTETAKSITVTVRDGQGSTVYVAQCMVSQHHIERETR